MAKRALAGVLRGLSLCVTVPALSARLSIAFREGRRGQGERAVDLGRGERNHVQGSRSRPCLTFPPLARMDLAKGKGGL